LTEVEAGSPGRESGHGHFMTRNPSTSHKTPAAAAIAGDIFGMGGYI
jgi:hypothetical protein